MEQGGLLFVARFPFQIPINTDMAIISGAMTSNLRATNPPNPLAQTYLFDPAELTANESLSNSNRNVTSGLAGVFGWGKTTTPRAQSGAYIFEFEIVVIDTFFQCGIGPDDAAINTLYAGQPYGSTILNWSGNTRHYNGVLATDFDTVTHVKNPEVGDIFTCAIDFDSSEVSWYHNGSTIIEDDSISLDSGKDYTPHAKVFGLSNETTIPATITYTRSGFTTW